MEALMDMAIDASFLFSYTNSAKLRINRMYFGINFIVFEIITQRI